MPMPMPISVYIAIRSMSIIVEAPNTPAAKIPMRTPQNIIHPAIRRRGNLTSLDRRAKRFFA